MRMPLSLFFLYFFLFLFYSLDLQDLTLNKSILLPRMSNKGFQNVCVDYEILFDLNHRLSRNVHINPTLTLNLKEARL